MALKWAAELVSRARWDLRRLHRLQGWHWGFARVPRAHKASHLRKGGTPVLDEPDEIEAKGLQVKLAGEIQS